MPRTVPSDRTRQGLDTFLANTEAQRRLDHGPADSALDQAAHLTGPPDPQWDAFSQALDAQGARTVIGGPSPDGGAIRGIPVQPDYFTSGDTFMGRPTAAAVLQHRARPMPEGHEALLSRLYGGA
jgi:hypothetical protein